MVRQFIRLAVITLAILFLAPALGLFVTGSSVFLQGGFTYVLPVALALLAAYCLSTELYKRSLVYLLLRGARPNLFLSMLVGAMLVLLASVLTLSLLATYTTLVYSSLSSQFLFACVLLVITLPTFLTPKEARTIDVGHGRKVSRRELTNILRSRR